ncbi:MAG: oligosaccharide flippase family protein [Nitrospira sp.]|nr:oligosaccharide flippase family protein [Nitrospira sp.]
MTFVARYVPKFFPKPCREFWDRVQSSPIAVRLLHGSIWSLAGSVVSRILALAAALLVARILGKATYGELDIVQSTIGMFGTLAGFGMGTTAAKFVAEFRHTDPAKAGRIIVLSNIVSWGMGLTLGVALFSFAPWLARHSLAAPELSPYIQLSALLLVLNAINGAQTGVLSGFESFRNIAWVNALTGLLNFPLVVAGALLGELSGAIWGMIIAQLSGCLANVIISRKEAARFQIPIVSWRQATAELPLLGRFAVPATLGSLLINPIDWACTAMLVRQPNGFEHVGAYSVATQWFGALLWLPYVLAQSVMPVLSERIGANDAARSTKLLSVSIKISAAVTVPFVVIGSLLSRQIMGAYGEAFAQDWPTLVVSLVTCAVVAVQVPAGNMIAASDRMWLGFGMNVLWATVFLVMTWLCVQWGALGLASARLMAYVAQGSWACLFAVLWFRNFHTTSQVPRRG